MEITILPDTSPATRPDPPRRSTPRKDDMTSTPRAPHPATDGDTLGATSTGDTTGTSSTGATPVTSGARPTTPPVRPAVPTRSALDDAFDDDDHDGLFSGPHGRLVAGLVVVLSLVLVGVLVALLLRATGAGDEDEPGAATAAAGEELTWAPPPLEDPETVDIDMDNRNLKLDQDSDYLLRMPDEPLTAPLSIWGGRNVVLIGGEIDIPLGEGGKVDRALALKATTGTFHVEGLKITGDGLGEGINLDQPEGATVQLQNIWIDPVQGARGDNHADVIQSWAGPSVLRIDRLSAQTTYQGFFLLPNQFGEQPQPELFDLRRIDLRGDDGAAYLLWRDEAEWPLETSDVWVDRPDTEDPDQLLWPKGEAGAAAWDGVQIGTPPGGPFVAEDTVGIGYVSPGYAEATEG